MIRMSMEFWKELKAEYPEQMSDFEVWGMEYLRREGWDQCDFQDMPNAMQLGVFIQYTVEHGGRQFVDMAIIEDGLSTEVWINRVRTWFKDEQGLQAKPDNF